MRYSDEEYEFNRDSFEKKNIARSSRNMRTHNGKGGAVKFPSDFMTKGQLKKMSGQCKTYRMNEAISWEEFKEMPDDLKVAYIKAIREKFGAPDKYIAEMLGVSTTTFNKYMRCLRLNRGSDCGANKKWNQDGFLAWRTGASDTAVEPSETPVEVEDCVPITDIADEEKAVEGRVEVEKGSLEDYEFDPISYTGHNLPVIPSSGTVGFMNNNADDALEVIKTLLGNVRVNLTVTWDCVIDDGACCKEA